MKKLSKLLAMLLCLGCVFGIVSISAFAEYKTIVNETFNDYKDGDIPDGWEMTHEDVSTGFWGAVTTDPTNSSNMVLGISSKDGTIVTAKRKFEPTAGMADIKWKIYLPEYEGVQTVGQTNVTLIQTYKNAWNVYNGATWYAIPNVSITYDRWLQFEMKFDYEEHTYDLFVDGMLIAGEHSMRDIESEYFDFLAFMSYDKTIYIDDVNISAEGEIKTRYTKITPCSTYRLDTNRGTLKNVPFETSVEEFMNNIEFVDGAVVKLLNPDGNEYHGRYIIDNLILDISSPEGDQNVQYKITSRWWIASLLTTRYCSDAIIFGMNSNDAMLNGNKNYIDPDDLEVKAFKEDSVMYVPLRFIAEQRGKTVSWIDSEKAVVIDDIKLFQNNSMVTKNNEKLLLEGMCINANSTIFVPLEWIDDIFDTQIRKYKDIAIIKDDVSFADSRMEKLVLNEIDSRY